MNRLRYVGSTSGKKNGRFLLHRSRLTGASRPSKSVISILSLPWSHTTRSTCRAGNLVRPTVRLALRNRNNRIIGSYTPRVCRASEFYTIHVRPIPSSATTHSQHSRHRAVEKEKTVDGSKLRRWAICCHQPTTFEASDEKTESANRILFAPSVAPTGAREGTGQFRLWNPHALCSRCA